MDAGALSYALLISSRLPARRTVTATEAATTALTRSPGKNHADPIAALDKAIPATAAIQGMPARYSSTMPPIRMPPNAGKNRSGRAARAHSHPTTYPAAG